jgi:uncharacterized iron-regulated protein
VTRFAFRAPPALLPVLLAAPLLGGAAAVSEAAEPLPPAAIYVLGEVHDNPGHHAAQADLVARIAPTALALEMLSPEQAARVGPDTPRDAETLGPLLDWADSGWPAIDLYAPVMAAAGAAPLVGAGWPFGAMPEADAALVARFALAEPLPPEEQEAREALQLAAHCDMLPEEALAGFVARQRRSDALMAAAVLDALEEHGPPVVLIAGNGHARADRGVPAAIARAAPEVSVVTVGQGEDGRPPEGTFDLVLDAPAPERGDPCAAFAR